MLEDVKEAATRRQFCDHDIHCRPCLRVLCRCLCLCPGRVGGALNVNGASSRERTFLPSFWG